MRNDWSHLDQYRKRFGPYGTEPGERRGCFYIPQGKANLIALAGSAADDIKWDHVSARARDYRGERTPTWQEMCLLKDLFWEKTEVVIQIHPAEVDYVNIHPHVLHLWSPVDRVIPLPPKDCV